MQTGSVTSSAVCVQRVLYYAAVAVLLCLVLTGCATIGRAEREAAVRQRGVVFPPDELPSHLIETLAGYRIVMTGGFPHSHEHQALVPALVQRLVMSGPEEQLLVMGDSMHALGWILEDYILGLRDSYPPHLDSLKGGLLEGLRHINRGLPEGDRFGYVCIGMNHLPGIAQLSLYALGLETGIMHLLVDVVEAAPDSPGYQQQLELLIDRVAAAESELRLEIGDQWYARLHELLEIELRSLILRRWANPRERELIMTDLILRRLQQPSLKQLVISVPIEHAQRTRFMGNDVPRLGEYLSAEFPDDLYSLAVFGLRGVYSVQPARPEVRRIPSPGTYSSGNLLRVINELSRSGLLHSPPIEGPGAVFLDLADRAFRSEMRMAFGGSELKLVPGLQFDGYLVFPEISVPH